VALSGIRAYLATACLPNCFWPLAGSCYAFSANLATKAYEAIAGEFKGEQFIFGQLCFFKLAPTIDTPAKTDNRLAPGIFLNYVVDPDGRFAGQYLVCPLSDFINRNLHHRAGPKDFKLHLHRTEVVRNATGNFDPVFPLRQAFWYYNYTIEGLENKENKEKTKVEENADKAPSLEPEDQEKKSDLIEAEDLYKIDARGRKLKVDGLNNWVRRTQDWRPPEVPDEVWRTSNTENKELFRKMFPDPRRDRIETPSSSSGGEGKSKIGTKDSDEGRVPPTGNQPSKTSGKEKEEKTIK